MEKIKAFNFNSSQATKSSIAVVSQMATVDKDRLLDKIGTIENDYLNRLLVLTGLKWQEIDVFRAISPSL